MNQSTLPRIPLLIDGQFVASQTGQWRDVVNPATGEAIGALPLAEPGDLDRALDVAAKGFKIWRKSTPQDRAAVLQGAARLMLERADDLARIATMEEGKPFGEACTAANWSTSSSFTGGRPRISRARAREAAMCGHTFSSPSRSINPELIIAACGCVCGALRMRCLPFE